MSITGKYFVPRLGVATVAGDHAWIGRPRFARAFSRVDAFVSHAASTHPWLSRLRPFKHRTFSPAQSSGHEGASCGAERDPLSTPQPNADGCSGP